MGGSTKRISTAPAETADLRNQVTSFLQWMTPGKIFAPAPPQTQSVDQLGGVGSSFFQNMMAQLQPAFTQERNQGLAAAKESAGNLTGSGFGNILGSAVNRSLGNEQQTLANYALHGIQQEMARQQGDANRLFQGQQSDAQRFLQLLQGQSLAGVGPDTIQQSGGIGSILGPIAGIAGSFLGGPGGAKVASKIFG